MKVFRDENGQMLVFTALTMTVLLGFLALATDVGTLFRARRQLQIAADAGATAAAMDLMYGNTTTQATTDAKDATAADGAVDGTGGTVVTVNIKPQNGFHTSVGYAEVLITQPNPTFFLRLFGRNTMTIGTRAVAGSPGFATNCIFLMDPTDYDFKVQGSFKLNAPGCGVYVNSKNSQSVLSASGAGGGLTIDSPYVTTVGGGPSSLGGAPIFTYAAPESPPNLQSTGFGSSDCTSTPAPPYKNNTINAGGGVACFTGTNVDITGLTLQDGVFVFENGVQAGNTGGTTTVSDATIEVSGGSFTQNSNSLLNISAPQPSNKTCLTCVDDFCGLSGTCLNFNAVGLLVPSSNTTYKSTPCASSSPGNGAANGTLQVQFGSNNQLFDGYIVAPNADIYLQDNGGGTTYSGIYAACMFGKSSTVNIPSYNVEHPATTPLRTVALVE